MKVDYYCVGLVVLILFFLYIDNSINLEGFASLDGSSAEDTPTCGSNVNAKAPKASIRAPTASAPTASAPSAPLRANGPNSNDINRAIQMRNTETIGQKPQKVESAPPPSMKTDLTALPSYADGLTSLDDAFGPLIPSTGIPSQAPTNLFNNGANVGGQGNIGEMSLGAIGGPVKPSNDKGDVVGFPIFDITVMGAPVDYEMDTRKQLDGAAGLATGLAIGSFKGSATGSAKGPAKELEVHMVYTEWCGHSKRALPHFDKAASELDGKTMGDYKVKFTKTDADTPEGKQIAKDNGVKGFPTHILKVDGKKIEGAVGRTYDELVAKVKSITG
jgi:thiol-disulfide isomerase/thioredoxin